jgi:hypothetical protein
MSAIDPHQIDTAIELCTLVHKPDLFAYLGLPETTSAEDALTALKNKRRYMQGMQSNPKYKAEAILFIKAYAGLQQLLSNPEAYRRHIYGPRAPAPAVKAAAAPPPPNRPTPTTDSAPPVRGRAPTPAAPVPAVLKATVPQAAVPKARPAVPKARPAVVELPGDPLRKFRTRTPMTVAIQVRTDTRMTVSSDEPWIEVHPNQLAPAPDLQVVNARVHPRQMLLPIETATVTFLPDAGEARTVVLEVERPRPILPFVVATLAALLLIGSVLAALLISWIVGMSGFS